MKKFLIIFLFTSFVVYLQAQSQGCSPDPQYSVAGVYPDSATNLSPAYVGQSYSENITIITPNDTDVVYNGFPLNVTIDNIELTSVTGLPSNFDYSCDPPNCTFSGGSVECAELFSLTDPTINDVGIYPIVFETTTTVSGIPLIGTTTQDDVIDYYYLEISNTTSAFNIMYDFTFELKDVFPNPVSKNARIQFISGTPRDVIFSIYNLLGEEIDSRIISANRGVNTLDIHTSLYSDGIYLYSVNDGYSNLTKRMIVKH